jgi:O-antigen ligase
MAVLVITISLIKSTSFLDSINWPKQIALVSIAPILVILAIQGSFELTRRASIQLSLLGICIAIHFIYFFFEGPPSHQKIWGQLDSSNGAITIASLLLITVAFSVFKNQITLTNVMLFFLFSLGITFSTLKLVMFADPINFYGNTNIVSFMFAIAFVSGLRFTFDKALGIKARSLSFVGIVVISTSLFRMDDFQGKVLAVLGTLIILIYTLIKNAKLRIFLYFLLFIASLTSFAIFSGWVQFLAAYTQETLQLRMMFWRTSLKMVSENFLFGVGAENFQNAFRDYADVSTLETIGNLPSPDNAHNYFLHLLATLGFFGAISIILPFLFAVYALLRERNNQKTIEEVVFKIVFLLIWLDLGISVSNVSITVLGMASLGIILGGESSISTREVKHRFHFSFLSPVLFIVAFGLFFFALDSTKVDREILKLEMKPINLNSSAEISLRVKDLMAIANNSMILKSESAVIALDLEALKARSLEILIGG